MSKLCLGLLLLAILVIVLVLAIVTTLRFSKNLAFSAKFRIYLISVVVIIATAIYLHFCVASLKDNKNSANNKEDVVFQL